MKEVKLKQKVLDKIVKKKYPNAVNIQLGENYSIMGIWFEDGENAKYRTFIPLNQ